MLIYVIIILKKSFLSDRQTHVQLKTIVRNLTKETICCGIVIRFIVIIKMIRMVLTK